MDQSPTSECTDVRVAPGTFDDLDNVLQAALMAVEVLAQIGTDPTVAAGDQCKGLIEEFEDADGCDENNDG